MRITDEVYLIGGGPTLAFGLSDDPDCHVYLIDGGGELALVDCGMAAGASLGRITANIEDEGLEVGRLRKLLLTHYHMDHAGGAARFRERFGLEVLAPSGAALALRTGDERAVALDVAKAAGFYDPDYRFEPVAVDRELNEGDRVRVGDLELTVYDTPGHCDGHASYLLHGRRRRYLFAGDAVFCGGRVVLQNIHDCSIQRSADSIAKLAGLDYGALLPGHAAIVVDGGTRHVELAADACRQLFVPKNLV
jgi:glyoxylase-like metal-dependent hydrolase (beta-lactamase superfamily II)